MDNVAKLRDLVRNIALQETPACLHPSAVLIWMRIIASGAVFAASP